MLVEPHSLCGSDHAPKDNVYPHPRGQNSRTSVPAKDPRKFCEKFWPTKFCRNFRLQQEQVTELCLQEALIVTVQARPAVVAFPQGSTCLCQEITLQTWRLTLQTCPSSIGVLPRYSCAVLPLAVTIGMLLPYPLKPLKLYRFCTGD